MFFNGTSSVFVCKDKNYFDFEAPHDKFSDRFTNHFPSIINCFSMPRTRYSAQKFIPYMNCMNHIRQAVSAHKSVPLKAFHPYFCAEFEKKDVSLGFQISKNKISPPFLRKQKEQIFGQRQRSFRDFINFVRNYHL